MLPGNFVPPESASTPPPPATPTPVAPGHDADHTSRNIRCLACRYDLKGLGPDAICPECAFPASLTRLEERRVSASYLHALSWSVWLTLAPVVLLLLGLISPMVDGMAASFTRMNLASFFLRFAPLSLIPWAVGVRSLATLRPPDDERSPKSPGRNRPLDIILTVITAIFIVSVIWLVYWPDSWVATPFGVGRGFHPAWVPAIICGQTLVIAHMRACTDIAERLANPRLHDSARAVFWCSIPVALLGLGFAMDLERAIARPLLTLELACSMALIAGAIGCICGLLGVCVSTFGALNQLRAFRKNLIRNNQSRTFTAARVSPPTDTTHA